MVCIRVILPRLEVESGVLFQIWNGWNDGNRGYLYIGVGVY